MTGVRLSFFWGSDGSDPTPDIVAGVHRDAAENLSEVCTGVSDRLNPFDDVLAMAPDNVLGEAGGEDTDVLTEASALVVADEVEDADHDIKSTLRVGEC